MKFGLFSQNPEGFIAAAEKLIRGEKAKLLLGQIQYHGMDDSFGLELFTQRQVRGREGQNAIPVKRSICSYLICDSKVELDFAKALEEHEAVELYVKLPKSFFLPTPVGRYTPDWAIVFRGADGSGASVWQRPRAVWSRASCGRWRSPSSGARRRTLRPSAAGVCSLKR